MMQQKLHTIVIGAGAMGCSAAWHLAKAGRSVLLLEQFKIGHSHGSSHGGSRVIRTLHPTADYASIMPATYELWRQLERESNEHLLQLSGGLYLGLPGNSFLLESGKTMDELGYPYQTLDAPEMRRRFPQFHTPDHFFALYEEVTGILAAGRCVKTLAAQAVRHGAQMAEGAKVLAVKPLADGVEVRYAQHGVEQVAFADRAVITAGPWAKQLLAGLLDQTLPLQVTRQQVAYYAVQQPNLYPEGRFPLFLFTEAPFLYGMQDFEHPGYLKIARDLMNTGVDPDQPGVVDQIELAEVSQSVAEWLVGVSSQPVDAHNCLYTETPNRDFVIDRHPDHPQIVFATGFSGRGFKFSINIGKLLMDIADSAVGEYKSPFWLPAYALNRFQHPEQQRTVAELFIR